MLASRIQHGGKHQLRQSPRRELTRDLPETDKVLQSGPDGTAELTVPMNSNDVVLVKLKRSRANN